MAWIIQMEGNIEIILIYTWNLHINGNGFDALEGQDHWMQRLSEQCSNMSNRGTNRIWSSTPSPCHWATSLISLSLGAPPCDCPEDDSDGQRKTSDKGKEPGVTQGHPHAALGAPTSLATFPEQSHTVIVSTVTSEDPSVRSHRHMLFVIPTGIFVPSWPFPTTLDSPSLSGHLFAHGNGWKINTSNATLGLSTYFDPEWIIGQLPRCPSLWQAWMSGHWKDI